MNAEQQTAEQVHQGSTSEKYAQGRNSDEGKKPEQASEAQRKRLLLVFTVVLVAAGLGGLMYWLHARHYEDTDDAQISVSS